MSPLEVIAVAFILYWLIYVLLWMLLDCNVELWFMDHFGKPIDSLRGQVVWITGASSGIGKALAVHLARSGVRLVLSARREQLLQHVRDECLKQSDGLLSPNDVLVLPMDMIDLNVHHTCFDQVLEHFGCLDILVNKAGRTQRANWEDINVQVDRDLFELDVFAIMHLSRIAVRYFMEHRGGHGHIAVNSSIAGIVPLPSSATYCAAKHALSAYMATLKVEEPIIDVTNFAPGPVATEFRQEAFSTQPETKVGKCKSDIKRMSAERCAHLFAVALANKSLLSWCGPFPTVFLTYLAQSQPLGKIIVQKLGKKILMTIRNE